MAVSYDAVKAKLLDVETKAFDLYELVNQSRLRGLASSLSYLVKTLNELLRERDFLKPSAADYRRDQLHILLQDSERALRRLDDFLLRLADRSGPPPDLRTSGDIQATLKQHADDLLHFNLALISEPIRRPSAILPPSSAPATPATKDKPTPTSLPGASDIDRKRSVRETRRVKDGDRRPSHRKGSSYGGGVSLPPPINTTAPTPTEATLKAPLSPYQPTVEEVPDEGTPDEETTPHVDEYYMTPPNSDEASSSFSQASSGASRDLSDKTAQKRPARDGSYKVQPPALQRKESGSDFLSPHDATRTRRGTIEGADDRRWQPPAGDFGLFDTTDDERDGLSDHSGGQTPFKVESVSATNTPIDRTQMPSPRPRRSSSVRQSQRPQNAGPNAAKETSPRYSPGHSPWANNKTYEDGRFRNAASNEKPSPRPSPNQVQPEPANPRRRAQTEARKPRPVSEVPYPTHGMFGIHGGERVFQFQGGAAAMGAFEYADTAANFREFFGRTAPNKDNPFAGPGLRKDESMRVHTGESPKEMTASNLTHSPTTLNPDESMRAHTGHSPNDSLQNSMTDSKPLRDSMHESVGEPPKQPSSSAPSTKVTEREVKLSLEDIFTGVTKKMIIRDEQADLKKVIEIPVRPGCPAGTRFKYNRIYFNADSAVMDLHFIVAYKPHATFRRDGDDLHCTVDIDLVESLCGWERYIDTICGKRKRVTAAEPTGPGWKDYMAGLGMPKAKNPDERGDLVVEVKVKYPSSLTQEQKDGVRKLLKG